MLDRFRTGDVRHCYADITEIKRHLGWEPTVGLREGVRDLVAWQATGVHAIGSRKR